MSAHALLTVTDLARSYADAMEESKVLAAKVSLLKKNLLSLMTVGQVIHVGPSMIVTKRSEANPAKAVVRMESTAVADGPKKRKLDAPSGDAGVAPAPTSGTTTPA